MYEELDTFERALQHFGTRVEVIAAMEMGDRISAEDAYQMIKDELKELKKGSEIMEERARVTEATSQDWEDFWYAPEKFGSWYVSDFENVWNEMEQIEPLTPITESQRKD